MEVNNNIFFEIQLFNCKNKVILRKAKEKVYVGGYYTWFVVESDSPTSISVNTATKHQVLLHLICFIHLKTITVSADIIRVTINTLFTVKETKPGLIQFA